MFRLLVFLGLVLPLAGLDGAPSPLVATLDAIVLAPEFARVPANVFVVSDQGARGDGKTLDTAAIQAAIDAAHAAGGGVVTFAPGTYLSGALFLKSRVELRLDAGVTIQAVADDAQYPRLPTRVAGIEMDWPAALINIRDAHDVRITGPGVIDGCGEFWWDKFNRLRADYEKRGLRWALDYDCERVRAVAVWRSSDVLLKDFAVHRSGFWSVVLTYCERARVDGLTIRAFSGEKAGPSTDGIDLDSSRLVLVENCTIDCNDDNICLKAGRDADGLRVNRPTEQIVIRDCTVLRGHGAFTIGSETSGGVHDVEVCGLKARGTQEGIRFKSAKVRGGVVEQIWIHDVDLEQVSSPFNFSLNWYPDYSYPTLPADVRPEEIRPHWRTLTSHVEPAERGIPEFRDIRLENIRARGAQSAMRGGAYAEKPMRRFAWRNVEIEAAKAGAVRFTEDWTFENVRLRTSDGASLAIPVSTATAAAVPIPDAGWPALTKENRPWAFNWWLGSAVDKVNLAKELDRYRDAGLGGIHVIPIYGATGAEARWVPFLSPAWMDLFDWTVAEAEKRGLGVDLTTGTGWCFGGPEVTKAEGGLKLVLIDTAFPADGQIKPPARFAEIEWKLFDAVSAEGARQDLRALVQADGRLNWTPPGGDVAKWTLVAVGVQSTGLKVKRAGPGGEGLMINPLYPAAMDHYLAPFRSAFEAGAGHRRPRAMYHDSYEYFQAAWSPEIAEEFFRRRGYRLEEHWDLFAGHGNPDEVGRLWHDYRETVSDVMLEKVFPLWTGWARDTGMLTRYQAHGSPGNILDLYALAQIPETEMFGHGGADPLESRFDEHIGGADRDIQVSKFASSAANLAGRRLVSSETGTWMAEHFHETFEELKCFMDRLFVAGVNHVFYHGCAYSPDDVAWPGWLFYAATELNTRNPLWREFGALNEYVARVQSVLQAASPDNDFLLYWPIGDYWSGAKPGLSLIGVHEHSWVPATGYRLFDQGYAFDYCSDRQIAALKTDAGGDLVAKGATYRTLVFPVSKTLPLETLRTALRLAEDGATICLGAPVADEVPGLLDVERRRGELRAILPELVGTSFTEVKELRRGKGRLLVGPEEKVLAAAGIAPEPALRVHPGLLMLRKAEPGGRCYFLVNHSLKPIDAWVVLGKPATNASAMNPLSGAISPAPLRRNAAGGAEVRLYLEPGHSVLLRTRAGAAEVISPGRAPSRPGEAVLTLDKSWRVEFITGGPELPAPWEPEHLASWAGGGDERRDAFSGTARYVTRFDLKRRSDRALVLDLGEVCEVARVRLNGHDLGVTFMRPHRLAIPADALVERDNRLEVEVTNLGANRLRDLDRRGVHWKDYFFVTIRYKDLNAAQWPLAPSGLLGPVTLREAVVPAE